MIKQFENIFMKKYTSQYIITYSSIHFTLFVILSRKKIDDRHLYRPGVVCLNCLYFEKTQNKKIQGLNIFYNKLNPNNAEFTFMEKNSERLNFVFFTPFFSYQLIQKGWLAIVWLATHKLLSL